MKFKKILVMDELGLDKEYWKSIDSLCEKKIVLTLNSPEIKEHLKDADCILVKFLARVDKKIIDATPKLKYVGVLATGYGRVDADYAKTKGISVCNVPGFSTESVAEFVFATILEHIRDLERGKKQIREGNYSEGGFSAIEIKGKVFGILGLGRIGGRTAELALAFGADVRYWSRNRKKEFEKRGIKYEDADELIKNSDILSLHFAKTKDTENFLNEQRIKTIKKGAVVINTSPMELLDLKTLEKRIQKGDITFILDHSDEMKPEDVKRLVQYKNCIIYPPIAYLSKEGRIIKQKIFVENIENFLKGNSTNKVN